MDINDLVSKLHRTRIDLSNEKVTQQQISSILDAMGAPYQREYRLDQKNIVDFFIDGVAIEVKLNKTAVMNIYRQCERYCAFDAVKQLLLVTNRAMTLPTQINGKHTCIVSLGRGWL